MCGLVGFVTASTPRGIASTRKTFLEHGLYIDTLRGDSGTGVGLIKPDSVEIYKRALAGPDFINSDVGQKCFRSLDNAQIALGHNRFPTHGAVKDRNCHPFYFKDKQAIVLTHNGVITNYSTLSPTNFSHEVDSAHITAAFASCDPDKNDELSVLSKINGSYVLIWYNQSKDTFNIARNNARDIYWVLDKFNNMFYSSEMEMLTFLVNRTGVDEPKAGFKYLYPEDNQWFEWKLKKFPEEYQVHIIEKPPIALPAIFRDDNRYSRRNGHSQFSPWYDQVDSVLSEYGYEVGEFVGVEMASFKEYPNSQGYGRIFGKTTDSLDMPIEVNGINQTSLKTIRKKFKMKFPAKVQSIRKKSQNEQIESEHVLVAYAHIDDLDDMATLLTKHKTHDWVEAARLESKKQDELNLGKQVTQLYKGPKKVLYTLDGWKQATREGCAYCTKVPNPEDHELIIWHETIVPSVFLCKDCATDSETKQFFLNEVGVRSNT